MRRPGRGTPASRVFAVRGSDGWLFLGGDSNDVLGQHMGTVKRGRVWERRWQSVFARRLRLARQVGAEWVHSITPDKESVYGDKLPAEIKVVDRRLVHRVMEIAERMNVPAMFPLEELRAAREQGP